MNYANMLVQSSYNFVNPALSICMCNNLSTRAKCSITSLYIASYLALISMFKLVTNRPLFPIRKYQRLQPCSYRLRGKRAHPADHFSHGWE